MDDSLGPGHANPASPNVDGIEIPLLLTKLYAPRLAPGLVSRPAHFHLLDRTLAHRVTVVSTPPGYGKSTLVSQWLEATRFPGAWISLDDADNDPTTFTRYLLAAIEEIDDSLTAATRRLMREHRGVPVRAIIDTLVTDLASATRPFVLVLDDFHVIQSPELLEGVGRFLTYAPPTMRIAIISRSTPRLPLMRVRAQSELLEIGASDLAFTSAETRALLCDRFELPIDEAQLAVLQSWSEGWPLGLMLLGQALQDRPHEQLSAIIDRFANNPAIIAEYLWRELIQRQPADKQAFLLQTSILEQFNAQACNAVTGRADAETMLSEVAEENLFLIPLGERRSWFRYHHLFQDVLRERLGQTFPNDEILALHSRAARWHLAEGLVEEAATHAIKANDWELALQILTPLCIELAHQERLSSVRTWLEAIPDEAILHNPNLSFTFAWSLVRLGQAARSGMFVEAAETAWRANGNTIGIARVLTIRALEDFFHHNTPRGVDRCQQALALLPDENVEDRARLYAVLGNIYAQAGAVAEAEAALLRCRLLAREMGSMTLQLIEMNASALCLLARGELGEAETVFQRVIATGDEWHDLPVVYAHLLLGNLYLDQHRLSLAEQILERALELAERLSARVHIIRIHRMLAELAWARHDSESALIEIDRSISAGTPGGFEMEIRHVRARLAHSWIQEGKFNLARAWAAELDWNLDQPPEFAHRYEYLVAVELLARTGDTRRAMATLDLAIAQAKEKGHFDHLLNMLLLKSVTAKSQGNIEESNTALTLAIAIGAPAAYVRPFLKFGNEIENQLHELSLTSRHARYIRHLLEQMRSDRRQGASSEELANPLSKRQTEIMQLVAAGYSNRDIADQLFISEQTVKKHLSTTFIRLEVSSRTQAIDACRRLSIL